MISLSYGDNMNYKKIFKRETKVIAYVVIALTLVVIGSSYALFMQVQNNTANQVVKAGSLKITYSSSNDSNINSIATGEEGMECLTPKTDDEGKNSGCDFKLSIYNDGTLPMAYDLLIYNNSIEIEQVELSNLKHQLTKQVVTGSVTMNKGELTGTTSSDKIETINEHKLLSELSNQNGDSSKKVLEHSVIKPKETIAFDLKIWIKDDAEEDIIGKTVSLKLDVTGVVSENDTLATTIENLAKGEESGIEKIEHETNIAPIAVDSNNLVEYRYTGANPNNYVYFGCDGKENPLEENVKVCTEDNLYRIIGIIPTKDAADGKSISRVKIIKNTYWTSLDSKTSTFTYTGDWVNSAVYKELNENYWNSLGQKYQKYVAPSVLYINTININGGYTAENLYNTERQGNSETVANVGLLYPSDYGYSIGNNTSIDKNSTSWLKVNNSAQEEWLLTSPGEKALTLKVDGSIGTGNGPHAIRPSVYLQENVYVIGGTGSQNDPYVLEFR